MNCIGVVYQIEHPILSETEVSYVVVRSDYSEIPVGTKGTIPQRDVSFRVGDTIVLSDMEETEDVYLFNASVIKKSDECNVIDRKIADLRLLQQSEIKAVVERALDDNFNLNEQTSIVVDRLF